MLVSCYVFLTKANLFLFELSLQKLIFILTAHVFFQFNCIDLNLEQTDPFNICQSSAVLQAAMSGWLQTPPFGCQHGTYLVSQIWTVKKNQFPLHCSWELYWSVLTEHRQVVLPERSCGIVVLHHFQSQCVYVNVWAQHCFIRLNISCLCCRLARYGMTE